MTFRKTKVACMSLSVSLLASACGKKPEPSGAPPPVTPVTVVDTISPEAQHFYANPPNTFVSMDSLPLMLKRVAIGKYQDTFGETLRQKYDPGVTLQETEIAGVPVLMVQPSKNRNPDQVLLNFHGGGWTQDAGSKTENIPIAALTGRTIVAVRYRLSPENPYPASVDDCLAVYRKLLETHDPKNIVVFGTSAGASTTAQLAVRLKRDGIPLPAALGMFSMISDFSRMGESMSHLNPLIAGPSKEELEAGQKDMLARGQDPKDPMLSPLYADLSGLPPTLLMSGTRDLLLSQTVLMHRAMLEAGDEVQLVVFEGMWHAHWAYLDLPESKAAFEIQARFIEKHLAK